jgi:hypothetical protein
VFVAKKGDAFIHEDFLGEQAVVMNTDRGQGLLICAES